MAFNVGTAFNQFCGSLRFSDNDLSTIQYRYHSITKRINLDYWGSSSDTANSLYVGSFGRDTEISTSDIDMLIRLPYETYKGNTAQMPQSALYNRCRIKTVDNL